MRTATSWIPTNPMSHRFRCENGLHQKGAVCSWGHKTKTPDTPTYVSVVHVSATDKAVLSAEKASGLASYSLH